MDNRNVCYLSDKLSGELALLHLIIPNVLTGKPILHMQMFNELSTVFNSLNSV